MKSESTRRKGKRFELEVAEWLTRVSGVRYRRTPMSGALRSDFPGDVMKMEQKPSCFDGVLIECKNVKRWTVQEWIAECEAEAKDGNLPYWLLLVNNRGRIIPFMSLGLAEKLFGCIKEK